jgi:hypothetical protein
MLTRPTRRREHFGQAQSLGAGFDSAASFSAMQRVSGTIRSLFFAALFILLQVWF